MAWQTRAGLGACKDTDKGFGTIATYQGFSYRQSDESCCWRVVTILPSFVLNAAFDRIKPAVDLSFHLLLRRTVALLRRGFVGEGQQEVYAALETYPELDDALTCISA